MKRGLLLIASLAAAPAIAAGGAEKIFAEARGYTAYIETRIETPFIEDRRGSMFGAAFVVDAKRRWLLTNAHVSGRSPAHITAMFAGSDPVTAWPVYIDPYLDLAVLEFDHAAAAPAAARLDCDDPPGTGHAVGAFGHPNGFKFSGSRGVITGRSYRFGEDWLQTDAPINAGNSGGPLISLETGRVVGINTATLRDHDGENANFAVLASHACRVIELLAGGREPGPPDLGVSFFREGDEDSLRVARVFAAGAGAGLRHGDVILGIAGIGQVPRSPGELVHLLRGRADPVRLEVRRDGATIALDARFAPRAVPLDRRGIEIGGALLGLTNQSDVEELAGASPVMVHDVAKGSAAEMARIKPYDHLVAVDGVPVRTLEDVGAAIRARAGAAAVTLEFLRPGGSENSLTTDILARLPVDGGRTVAFSANDGQRLTRDH